MRTGDPLPPEGPLGPTTRPERPLGPTARPERPLGPTARVATLWAAVGLWPCLCLFAAPSSDLLLKPLPLAVVAVVLLFLVREAAASPWPEGPLPPPFDGPGGLRPPSGTGPRAEGPQGPKGRRGPQEALRADARHRSGKISTAAFAVATLLLSQKDAELRSRITTLVLTALLLSVALSLPGEDCVEGGVAEAALRSATSFSAGMLCLAIAVYLDHARA